MIHQYQNNGYNIVLDVNSGAVHVVDQEAYDVIAVLNEMNAEHTPETLKAPETETVLKEKLGDRYTEEDLKDILDAVTELTEQGRLFTKDIYENLIGIVKQRKTVVKALCLQDFFCFLNLPPGNPVLSFPLHKTSKHVFRGTLLLLQSSTDRQGCSHVRYEDIMP